MIGQRTDERTEFAEATTVVDVDRARVSRPGAEDDAAHRQPPTVQRLAGERRMVEGAETGSGDDDDLDLDAGVDGEGGCGDVSDRRSMTEVDEESTGALDQDDRVACGVLIIGRGVSRPRIASACSRGDGSSVPDADAAAVGVIGRVRHTPVEYSTPARFPAICASLRVTTSE